MLRDRGNIKWQGMMLPEHTNEINSWMEKDQYTDRPQLDEWDLQAIQYELDVAYKRKCQTSVKYWEKGKVNLYMGVLTEINSRTMCISIDSPFGRDNMLVVNIVSVQIAE